MTVHPHTPTTASVTNARPVVVLRALGDVVEVDLDARRATQAFHPALARVARVLATLDPAWSDDTPPTWRHPDEHGDRIDPRVPGTRRCRHRLHLNATHAATARDTLEQAGYAVDIPSPLGSLATEPRDPEEPHVTPGAAPGEVDPFARCDAPMPARYHDEAGRCCGQRAYVVTAHRVTAPHAGADDAGTLAWCAHHYREIAAPTAPYVVADSRHLLTPTTP
ncbi:hypothetical protein [Xylanimonas ulmi]|uniref:Uncharacterized protein n=1 Tax=Xylanimonas ulmi TaxID=228973 RepID=A0A4Q7M5C8_9MICO|nr:hypothetical protein [Xylanibacterium ulmi]RZS62243.1 hypothetical protein EV386_2568 [Xylanibacterium ulmi]